MRGAPACCSLSPACCRTTTVRWWVSAVTPYPSLLIPWLATCQPERAKCARSPSEHRQRAIDACQYFLFPQHLQQMIEARAHVAAGHSKTSGMHDRADFDAEL